ncbi:MAG: hypothetical protein ACM368_16825 [Gemmatimonadota bacterium]
MGFGRGVRLRWRALFRRAATEQELDDEIRSGPAAPTRQGCCESSDQGRRPS